jgi:hypothetical protein
MADPTEAERLAALELRVFGPKTDPAHTVTVGETVTIPIGAMDKDEAAQPLPPGDTFTALANTVGPLEVGISSAAGALVLVLTALKPATDVLVTVRDSKGLRPAVARFDVVPVPAAAEAEKVVDPTPVALTLDVAKVARVEPEKAEPPKEHEPEPPVA